jgi:hypothetical protein
MPAICRLLRVQANKHFNKEAALREAEQAVKAHPAAYNKDDFFDMVSCEALDKKAAFDGHQGGQFVHRRNMHEQRAVDIGCVTSTTGGAAGAAGDGVVMAAAAVVMAAAAAVVMAAAAMVSRGAAAAAVAVTAAVATGRGAAVTGAAATASDLHW